MELYDSSMVEFGAFLSQNGLYNEFNSAHLPRVLSQRDVPGITRSVIPFLKVSNVTAISIGANIRVAPLNGIYHIILYIHICMYV